MSLKYFLLTACVIILSAYSFSQTRLGYTNSSVAYTAHPSYQMKMDQIEAYEEMLTENLEKLQKEIQDETTKMDEMKARGELEVVLRDQQNTVIRKQQQFDLLLSESQELLVNFRSKTLQPLINELDSAIVKSAKANNLDAVFQNANLEGVSFVLYAPESASLNANLLTEIKSDWDMSELSPYSMDKKKVKVGYTNMEMVLMAMSETKTMESSLDFYRDQLIGDYTVKQKSGSTILALYNAEEDPKKKEAYLAELNKTTSELQKMEAEFDQKIEEKRTDLLAPILEKLEGAINKVAEKNKIDFVLNQTNSSGISTIVFGPDNADISNELFNELGIENPSEERTELDAKVNPKIGFINAELIMANMPEVQTLSNQINSYQINLQESAQRQGKDPYRDQQVAQEIAGKVSEYKSKLLNPLMTRVQEAIDSIAAEQNCDFIINQTGGNVLYANSPLDFNEQLSKKLGLKFD